MAAFKASHISKLKVTYKVGHAPPYTYLELYFSTDASEDPGVFSLAVMLWPAPV